MGSSSLVLIVPLLLSLSLSCSRAKMESSRPGVQARIELEYHGFIASSDPPSTKPSGQRLANNNTMVPPPLAMFDGM